MPEKKEKTKYEILAEIQAEIKSKKEAKNDFGGYNYRNIEVMLASIKPILKEHNSVLFFDDDIVKVSERYYMMSIAHLITPAGDVAVKALAREQEAKKGMDAAQITGSCATYAHKYAVQAMFAIDDGSQDPDTSKNAKNQAETEKEAAEKSEIIAKITHAANVCGKSYDDICKTAKVSSLDKLSIERLEKCYNWIAEESLKGDK